MKTGNSWQCTTIAMYVLVLLVLRLAGANV